MNGKYTKEVIHIIGIGGIGMSGIAKILREQGLKVQGSDINENRNIISLRALGIKVFIGHNQQNLKDVTVVVKSSAIKKTNPEYQYAIQNNLKIYSRADMLYEITKDSYNIAITGAHGKTSTTALVYCLTKHLNPSLICGGILNQIGSNAILAKNDLFVLEADESDATFNKIRTDIAIITNLDKEHLDFYGNFANLLSCFFSYISNTLKNGYVIACVDCSYINKLQAKFTKHARFITYSLTDKKSDLMPVNLSFVDGKTYFDLKISDKARQILTIEHNIQKGFCTANNADHELSNLMPALFVSLYYKLDIPSINHVMRGDLGVARRYSVLKIYKNITFIDDYAHHPKEIDATLSKTRKLLLNGAKIIVVFEPHKYSRLEALYEKFIQTFRSINNIIVLDVYSAGEKYNPEVNAEGFVKDLQEKFQSNAVYGDNADKIFDTITKVAKENDYILFVGAGNISKIAKQIINRLA